MKVLKGLALATLASLSVTACTTMPSVGVNAISTVTGSAPLTTKSNIGEKARVGDKGFSESKYKKAIPTGEYAKYEFSYEGATPTVKRINGLDLVKTDYVYAKHIDGIRYALMALVDPKTKDVSRSSLRVVSSTGTGLLAVDSTIDEKKRADAPKRNFYMVIDQDGRIFKLTEAAGGEAQFCNEHGCRYEQAYDMEVSPKFLRYYAKGGSLSLISDERPVEIYLPKNMMKGFYEGLKKASE